MIEYIDIAYQEMPISIAVNEYRTVILDVDATGDIPALGLTPSEARKLGYALLGAASAALEEPEEK